MGHHDAKLFWALRSEVAKGNVTMRGDEDNYVIFKYNTDCHINDKWNGTNRKARGIIFYAPTERIVCRPFDKFFNLDERQETKLESLPTSDFIVWEKLDGSCCSSFLYFNEIRCSTPGSYESNQAKWASKRLQDYLASRNQTEEFKKDNHEYTFIFEGIWPETAGNPAPCVLNYGDREELVLLSIRRHSGLELSPPAVDVFAERYGFTRPRKFDSVAGLTRDLKDTVPDNEEGYVIQYPADKNFRVKVKSPKYMMLHRMRENITYKGLCEIMEAGESRRWIQALPDHMRKRADDILAELNQEYYRVFYLVEDCFKEAEVLGSRKEQALYILNESGLPPQYTGLVFANLDNKFSERLIWGVLKKEKRFQPVEFEG